MALLQNHQSMLNNSWRRRMLQLQHAHDIKRSMPIRDYKGALEYSKFTNHYGFGPFIYCTRITKFLLFAIYIYPIMIFGRYCNAFASCMDWISSLPTKFAIVRASFGMR